MGVVDGLKTEIKPTGVKREDFMSEENENQQTEPNNDEEVTFNESQQNKINELITTAKSKEKAKAKIENDKLQSKVAEIPDLIKQAIEKHDQEANMTDKEKADAESKELKAELEKLKLQNAKRERLDTARKLVADKELPTSFADLFVGNTDEETQANIDNVKSVFDKAVQESVEKRLSGGKTPQVSTGTQVNTNKAVKDMSLEELTQLALENPDAVKGYLHN